MKRIQDADCPLEHSKFRTAVGKLLWLVFVRPDCSYAVEELNRDVKAPTQESLAKLKHVLRYLAGARQSVLRLRPNQMLASWKSTIDVIGYVDSDWAGCSKTRKSTSGSTIQILGCDIVHTSGTRDTVALSSGEAELYAIGQGINEALFVRIVRSLILEAEFARRVHVIVYTDSTAGKSIASRFGTGKRTKHVELRFLYMQNLIFSGLLRLCKIHTKDNPADLLTKYVSTEVLRPLINKIGGLVLPGSDFVNGNLCVNIEFFHGTHLFLHANLLGRSGYSFEISQMTGSVNFNSSFYSSLSSEPQCHPEWWPY